MMQEWMPSVIQRYLLRRQFASLRAVAYEGLINVLDAPAGAARPLWSDVFTQWAQRAQRRNHRAHARAYKAVARRLFDGHSLSDALKPFVPIEDVLIIESGEASGELRPALAALYKSYETEQAIADTTRDAFKAPAGALLGFLAISALMGWTFWPQLLEAVDVKYWDGWAMPMVHFQLWFAGNAWSVLPFVMLVAGYFYSRSRWIGFARRVADDIGFLPYSAYRDQVAAKFLLVLASLMSSRILLDRALHIIAQKGSPYLRWHIRFIRQRKELYPTDLSRMFNTGLFNDAMLDRIGNAATGVQPDVALRHIGNTVMDSVVQLVRKRAQTTANIMYMVVGLLFVWYSAVLVLGFQSASDRMMKNQRNSGQQMTSVVQTHKVT